MYASLIPFVRDDGRRTTAEIFAAQQQRNAQEAKPAVVVTEHRVYAMGAAPHIKHAAEFVIDDVRYVYADT